MMDGRGLFLDEDDELTLDLDGHIHSDMELFLLAVYERSKDDFQFIDYMIDWLSKNRPERMR